MPSKKGRTTKSTGKHASKDMASRKNPRGGGGGVPGISLSSGTGLLGGGVPGGPTLQAGGVPGAPSIQGGGVPGAPRPTGY